MFAVSDAEVLWVSIARFASELLPSANCLFVWDTAVPPNKALPPDVILNLSALFPDVSLV